MLGQNQTIWFQRTACFTSEGESDCLFLSLTVLCAISPIWVGNPALSQPRKLWSSGSRAWSYTQEHHRSYGYVVSLHRKTVRRVLNLPTCPLTAPVHPTLCCPALAGWQRARALHCASVRKRLYLPQQCLRCGHSSKLVLTSFGSACCSSKSRIIMFTRKNYLSFMHLPLTVIRDSLLIGDCLYLHRSTQQNEGVIVACWPVLI